MIPSITLLISARNAAATIERALHSAIGESISEAVLVDDWSDDDTAERARQAGVPRLRILRPPVQGALGLARQTAIEAVNTPVGIWLDADDEWLPGRAERLLAIIEGTPADFVFDGAEIVSVGVPGPPRGAPIPAFMHRPGAAVRLFERNYVPTLGVFAFRTEAMRALGYDVSLHGGEDLDVALRAVSAGRGFGFIDAPGYRIHARPDSLSRQSANQRAMCRTALAKHTEIEVLGLYSHAGFSTRIALWALASLATFKGDYRHALDVVDDVAGMADAVDEVLEPDGPEPWPEAWRVAFSRGTLLLLMDRTDEGIAALSYAEELRPSAEGANNLGVGLVRAGRVSAGTERLADALVRRPDYADARDNLASDCPSRITTHPLRHHPARLDY